VTTSRATIAVFGGSLVAADSDVYQAAISVGRELGRAGYAVMTGGYGGVMLAASQGAAEAGAHVIGVTLTRSGQRAERQGNAYVTENIVYETMRERLHHLVERADGYVVMPGGVGTLQELAEAWQLLRISALPPRPLICYGAFWRGIVAPLLDSAYVPDDHAARVQLADTPDTIIDLLNRWY